MTRKDALDFMRSHPGEDDGPDEPEVEEELFVALYERETDEEDYAVGLWSLLCAGEPWDRHV